MNTNRYFLSYFTHSNIRFHLFIAITQASDNRSIEDIPNQIEIRKIMKTVLLESFTKKTHPTAYKDIDFKLNNTSPIQPQQDFIKDRNVFEKQKMPRIVSQKNSSNESVTTGYVSEHE